MTFDIVNFNYSKALKSSPPDQNKERLGILICGHGSRNKLAVKEFETLALSIDSRLSDIHLEYGYLEFARPILTEALDRLREKSVNRVIALPAMLFAAGHAKNDIPALLRSYSEKFHLKIEYGRELGVDNRMISAAGARLKEAIGTNPSIKPSDTLLVVVGRGSSDPDANSNVSKITRILVESFGFGWGETFFSGVTFPLVEPGLRYAVKLGFKKIIIFPYFLFSGVLVSRIRRSTQKVALENPDLEFINADYLSAHPLVIETFVDRFQEVLFGQNNMNCLLCKYRSNLIGFEDEVGLAQESHHHHVEGIEESCSLCETECTELCQAPKNNSSTKHAHGEFHEHTHSFYPQADHPLGPVSLHNSEVDQICRE